MKQKNLMTIALAVFIALLASVAVRAQDLPPRHLDPTPSGGYVLACDAPVVEPHEALFHAAIVGALTLHGIDLAQTEYVIGSGLGHEANPVLQPFSGSPAAFGAFKLGTAALIGWALVKLHADPKTRWRAVALLAFQYGVEVWCVVHNAHVLQEISR